MPSNSKEYQKEYYAKHKETTAGKQSELIRCECCDKNISKWNINKHKKSAKHILNASPKPADLRKELELQQEKNDDKYDDLMAQVNIIQDTMNKMNVMAAEDPLMYCWGCQESFKESEKSFHKCKK